MERAYESGRVGSLFINDLLISADVRLLLTGMSAGGRRALAIAGALSFDGYLQFRIGRKPLTLCRDQCGRPVASICAGARDVSNESDITGGGFVSTSILGIIKSAICKTY